MRGVKIGFPDTYADLETGLLLAAYREGPARLRESLQGLSPEALRAEPIEGKWSIMAIGLHVVDSELVGAVRIRQVLGADGPRLPAYDQDRWSRDFDYAGAEPSDLERGLRLFEALRASTLPLFTGAGQAAWKRSGVHPEHGPVTLRNLLELYADHSERHLEQIVARRRLLGFAIDVPPILPRRLY